MGIIWTIIIGAIVGAIAKFIMPGGNEPKGFILTAILGIVGALVANWIANNIGILGTQGVWGFVSSIIGAIIVLVIYGMVFKPKA
ncbi:MAG: GlsB/YeaQ/YmgE family stress response membrane protein [Rhizobiales bacterium]|nr:GlsB/YeaQ/YmgE family stress response membrane protein [Hyphomicrobiales bacterium]